MTEDWPGLLAMAWPVVSHSSWVVRHPSSVRGRGRWDETRSSRVEPHYGSRSRFVRLSLDFNSNSPGARMRRSTRLLSSFAFAVIPAALGAQTFRSADTVIRKMWQVGIEQSQTEKLAQALIDSIGPRLSGSPGFASAVDWVEGKYKSWGIPVKREQYGTWRGWRQGTVHMELTSPRVQNLEVELLAWSPPTPKNGPVEGDVVVIPELADSVAAKQWLGTIRGKFVLVSAPEVTCRAPQELERFARAATVTKINQQRTENQRIAGLRLRSLAAGVEPRDVNRVVFARLDSAGVIGVGSNLWSGGWG